MPILREAEAAAAAGHEAEAWAALRRLSLDDFGRVLLEMPKSDYPGLSALLPAMASERVQLDWTGGSGVSLLRLSVTFIRTLSSRYEALTGRRLSDASILDYGCGC